VSLITYAEKITHVMEKGSTDPPEKNPEGCDFFPRHFDKNQAFGEEIVFSREQYGFHSLRQEDS